MSIEKTIKWILGIGMTFCVISAAAFIYDDRLQMQEAKIYNKEIPIINNLNIKKYQNYDYYFEYPDSWLLLIGDVDNTVSLMSPENIKTLAEGNYKNNYYLYDLIIEKCLELNTWCGNLKGDRVYKNLEDLLSDENSFIIHSTPLKTMNVNGETGYWVKSGGMDNSPALIFERDNGIYSLIFPSVSSEEEITLQQKQILSSFKFINKSSPFQFSYHLTSGAATDIYVGTTTVSGKYKFDKGPNVHMGEVFTFFPDDSSSAKLPAVVPFDIASDNTLKMFNLPGDTCHASGTAEIEIKDFWWLKAEMGGLSSSNLMKVISNSNEELKTFSETDENCGLES